MGKRCYCAIISGGDNYHRWPAMDSMFEGCFLSFLEPCSVCLALLSTSVRDKRGKYEYLHDGDGEMGF